MLFVFHMISHMYPTPSSVAVDLSTEDWGQAGFVSDSDGDFTYATLNGVQQEIEKHLKI